MLATGTAAGGDLPADLDLKGQQIAAALPMLSDCIKLRFQSAIRPGCTEHCAQQAHNAAGGTYRIPLLVCKSLSRPRA